MAIVVLALGSNMGNKLQNLREACKRVSEFANIQSKACVYETPPAFYEQQDNFYNSAIAISTELDAFDLLKRCKEIESDMGREASFRNAPRPIDLDIIFIEGKSIFDPVLNVPHIDWQNRDFVITPLIDLCEYGVFNSSTFNSEKQFLTNKKRAFKKIADL